MDACSAWARGSRFADVLLMTPDVFEGSLVRAVRRTEELMRQVSWPDTAKHSAAVNSSANLVMFTWLPASCCLPVNVAGIAPGCI